MTVANLFFESMFHQLTYDTFGLQPLVCGEAIKQLTFETFALPPKFSDSAAIKLAESRLGVHLPAAVREWYVRPDAVTLVSRQDTLLPLESLKLIEHDGGDYLLCMFENQGVCHWAFEVNQDADPKVIVNVDGQGWKLFCDHFSELVFGQIWDWESSPISACAQALPLLDADLLALRKDFRSLPGSTSWPGNNTYRFMRGDESLLLWSAELQCDWTLRAKTPSGFKTLLTELWAMSKLVKSLYGNDTVSEEILAQMRQANP